MASASSAAKAVRPLPGRPGSRWLWWWIAGVVLVLVPRSLSQPGLWWHLARGREVVAGTMFPSQKLLALESARDADWLGGLPFFLTWSVGGVHALAAIPLALAGLILIFARRRISSWNGPAAVLFVPLLLWTIRDALEPVPVLFDLAGMLILWRVLLSEWSPKAQLLAVALVMAAWANLGPRPVWGLLVIAFFSPSKSAATGLKLLAVAVLAGMLTPRGIFTWRDALVLFFPSAFQSLGPLAEPDWFGSFRSWPWQISELAFAVLWCGWIVRGLLFLRADVFPSLFLLTGRWSLPMLAVLFCRGNIAPAGLWILLDVLGEEHPAPLPGPSRLRTAGTFIALAAVLGLGVMDALGRGLPPYRRWGWGISHELDPRLLEGRLLSVPDEEVVGWAPDERSAGLISWLGGNVRMADHPERALLGGRLPEHEALAEDLLGDHRALYRREDGSWGGWVSKVDEWNVGMLFLPAEAMRLNEALVESTWKPVDLDSPAVPYVSADDLRFARPIVDILQQRNFVEVGPWRPTPEIYAGHGWRYDFVDLLGGGPDPVPAIRQSRLFRSLDLPLASLRALLPVRQESTHPRLREEFLACQKDLAYEEWITFGQSSEFRRRVVNALSESEKPASTAWLGIEETEEAAGWAEVIPLYRAGRIREALDALPRQSHQQHYAAAMLWIEIGESARALAEFEHLLEQGEAPALRIAAEYWREQILPFVDQ